MRYSQVNSWYRVEEVLSGLDGTSSASVQAELLGHLGSGRMKKLEQNDRALTVHFVDREPIVWMFSSSSARERFVAVVCEWFESQKVCVPELS